MPDKPFRVGPFHFHVRSEGENAPALRRDVILLELSEEDDRYWISLPQFDIETSGEEFSPELLAETFMRLMGFYKALNSLPKSYISEVERIQLALLNEVWVPWFVGEVAKHHQESVVEIATKSATKAQKKLPKLVAAAG